MNTFCISPGFFALLSEKKRKKVNGATFTALQSQEGRARRSTTCMLVLRSGGPARRGWYEYEYVNPTAQPCLPATRPHRPSPPLVVATRDNAGKEAMSLGFTFFLLSKAGQPLCPAKPPSTPQPSHEAALAQPLHCTRVFNQEGRNRRQRAPKRQCNLEEGGGVYRNEPDSVNNRVSGPDCPMGGG
jgi:hypothetical protein